MPRKRPLRYLREDDIEAYFTNRVREADGWAPKCVSPGTNGFPDRMVFWPHGMHHVELKTDAEDSELSPAQKLIHAKLRSFGRLVFVLRNKKEIDEYVSRWRPRPAIQAA